MRRPRTEGTTERVAAGAGGVHVRRAYFDCRVGQLNTRTAFPASGGFDERTTLLCLHPQGTTSRVFEQFLPEMAHDRSVYAPDLPGCGESDAPPQRCTIAEYATLMADFAAGMRFGRLDALGYGAGAFVAAELALAQSQKIRRVVLVAPALRIDERIAERPDAPATEELAGAGPGARWFAAAARDYVAGERFLLLKQPTLLVRSGEESAEQKAHLRQFPHNVRTAELPGSSEPLFRATLKPLVELVRQFLSAS